MKPSKEKPAPVEDRVLGFYRVAGEPGRWIALGIDSALCIGSVSDRGFVPVHEQWTLSPKALRELADRIESLIPMPKPDTVELAS